MARTAITTSTTLSAAGIDPTAVDGAIEAADGNSFPWRANRLLFVLNGDEAAVTPTFLTSGTVGKQDLAVADLPGVACAPAGYRLYGPFGPEFRQDDGSVYVNWAGTTPTGITAAVLDLDA